ncbi:MAG: glutathione peroxidase [Flavobacteriales bacterium]|nr:glutathione peroxidase [Flavobacteriales bacterium]
MVVDVQNTTVLSANGEAKLLGEYSDNVILVVNVASYCGNTIQYEDLQKLHNKYSKRGLRILAFPCNDFGDQEPDSLTEIKNFCSTKYGVEFEIMGKVHAKGNTTEPFTTLNKVEPKGDVEWNFEKFLIGKDSNVIARFKPDIQPLDANLVAAIEVALDF